MSLDVLDLQFFCLKPAVGVVISIFEPRNVVAQNKFYDLELALKFYGLGYGIQDTIEKKICWKPMATTIYWMYYVILMTLFEITFDLLWSDLWYQRIHTTILVLRMVSKNHLWLSAGVERQFDRI